MFTVFLRSGWFSASAVVAFALFGCESSDGIKLGEVSGVVTQDGKPLPKAEVTFTPESGDRISTGSADASGKYSLIFTRDRTGAVVGKHSVSVRLPGEMDEEGRNEVGGTDFDLDLTVEVKAGSNTIDIDVTEE